MTNTPTTVAQATLLNPEQRQQLKARWANLKAEAPTLRIRNAAERLQVSEAELLCTDLGRNVFRLNQSLPSLLVELEAVGPVLALSRNELMVHEKHGQYTDFKIRGNGAMGICLGAIDLRVFLNEWRYGFSVTEATDSGTRQSLQFFDQEGAAIHKIYKTAATDSDAWDRLIARHISNNQDYQVAPEPYPTPVFPNSGNTTTQQVLSKWEALKDVHQFHGMLQQLGISRVEALRLVGRHYAQPLPVDSFEQALCYGAEHQVPLMVFVNNRGIVQIHTGILNKLLRTGPWFNVLDPDFNLHANTDAIDQVWLVQRPSVDGIITSLEVYDRNAHLVLTLFGERKPGHGERDDWRALTEQLRAAHTGAA
ncbi:hemin-degrading factor [Ketobacter sp.]|uniref:hemin-degrading factor n=1 Tax=Ketobacter sp. TaxID=2083498 RepID=UPI000F15BDE1|nr:ChuX/HutX family heme-like substrate-binding protein [Ketobacter sp.]RLU00156.1 MAG: hemin-degrading factor [Ketobacter sp.]